MLYKGRPQYISAYQPASSDEVLAGDGRAVVDPSPILLAFGMAARIPSKALTEGDRESSHRDPA